jgi:hypothetical protein
LGEVEPKTWAVRKGVLVVRSVQGTVRDLYLLNGGSYQIGQSQTFDEFGKLTNTTAAFSNMALAAFGTYYAGHQLDPLGNLYYAGARWYDPTTELVKELVKGDAALF